MPTEWLLGLLGGLMIGGAAAAFLLGLGKVMGASGIIAGLMNTDDSVYAWLDRAVFVGGLVLVPAVFVHLGPGQSHEAVVSWPMLALAGLLVGFGSRLGNGCTSGHGVCGISRLAPRGIVATGVYLSFGVIAVALARGLGWS